VLLIATSLLTLACTPTGPSEADDGPDAVEPSEETVPIPEVRLSPFCRTMIDLAAELETDPPDDVTQTIIDTYEEILPDVPAVLRADFEVVLADLRGEPVVTAPATETPPTTFAMPELPPATDQSGATIPVGDPFADEGRRLPGETPSERISGYVDFACRGNQNNPGPPPTEPLEAPTTSADN
jgi:hypothetical protein